MSRRANAMLVAMLVASPLVAAPQVWASGVPSGGALTGGALLGGPSSAPPGVPAGSGGTAPAPAQAPSLLATATGDGITVTTTVSSLLGRALVFAGTAPATSTGATIVVQRLDPQAGWLTVGSGTVTGGGAFSVLWRTNYAGRMTMRTVLERSASATASQAAQTAPILQITVYRPGIATIYGKGFFGQKTACGKTLRRATLGVASRTLKCGTQVQIYYRGRAMVVPVIDRGPYANNASWDLTEATAQALGIIGTETVGAMTV